MASIYSSDLKLELMATGENAGTWGTKTNANLNLIQQSVPGYQEIDVASGDVTLAMTDATISNARNMTLKFTGTLAANRTVNFPASIEKVFNVIDGTDHAGYTLTFKVTSANGFLLCEGNNYICHSDGGTHAECCWGAACPLKRTGFSLSTALVHSLRTLSNDGGTSI